jgi:hypothetical protein
MTTRDGTCQCGAVRLSVTPPVLLTYACFCTRRQKRTGSDRACRDAKN